MVPLRGKGRGTRGGRLCGLGSTNEYHTPNNQRHTTREGEGGGEEEGWGTGGGGAGGGSWLPTGAGPTPHTKYHSTVGEGAGRTPIHRVTGGGGGGGDLHGCGGRGAYHPLPGGPWIICIYLCSI